MQLHVLQHKYFLSVSIFFFSLMALFFFAQPSAVQAVTCAECAADYQIGYTICETEYDVCDRIEFRDVDLVCQPIKDSCIADSLAMYQACVSSCGEPSAAPSTPSSSTPPPAPSEPRAIRSPGFDVLIDEGILRANISSACKEFGKCQITDMIQILINVMTFILGLTGSVFLLIFVWGGFTWLTSAGQVAKFQKGLDTIRDATIGLVIVFAAYIIVNSVLSLVTRGTLPTGDLNNTLNNTTSVQTIQINTN